VIRRAESIRIGRKELTWSAYPAAADIEHDLCVLAVPELLTATPAVIGPTAMMRLGDPVIAAGYPKGGHLNITHGEIKGLHAHDGALVLQISAAFGHGQSGGGVFDDTGVSSASSVSRPSREAVSITLCHWLGPEMPSPDSPPLPPPLTFTRQRSGNVRAKKHHCSFGQLRWKRTGTGNSLLALRSSGSAPMRPTRVLALPWRTMSKLKRDQAAARAFAQAATLQPSLAGTRTFLICPPK
jgi:hypothetical protein